MIKFHDVNLVKVKEMITLLSSFQLKVGVRLKSSGGYHVREDLLQFVEEFGIFNSLRRGLFVFIYSAMQSD